MLYDYDGEKTYSYSKYMGPKFLTDYILYRTNRMLNIKGKPVDRFLKEYELHKKTSSMDNYLFMSFLLLKKYKVTTEWTAYSVVTVEANSPQEAEEKVYRFEYDSDDALHTVSGLYFGYDHEQTIEFEEVSNEK